jgi:HlyD family secretion protein
MATSLFRASALQQLSSPEQLDQLVRITPPRAWIALSALGFVLLATLLWSVFGSLPSAITGAGLVIAQGGTYNIVAQGGGVITDFGPFHPGDRIREGQVLGHLDQPVLALQRDAARAEVERLQAERRTVLAEIAREQPAQARSAGQQARIQQATIHSREQLLASLKVKLAQQQPLLAEGLITRQRFEETRQAIFQAENEIDSARNAQQALAIEAITTQGRFEERTRRIEADLLAARHRLQDAQAQYALASTLVSPHDGAVVEVLAARGDTVAANQPVLSVEQPGGALEAVVYLPPMSEAKRIRPGQPVQVALATARKERYGYLVGRVTSVAKYPATEQGMLALFNNPGLARELARGGPPIAVSVELLRDPATRSGYRWSSQAGRALEVNSGTLTTATFTIEEQRPISLLIPLLRQGVGL